MSAFDKQALLLDLIDNAPDDADEVKEYAYLRLAVCDECRRRSMAEQISKAEEGNFLYVRYILDDLLLNPDKVNDIGVNLPKGLNDIYQRFLKRELVRNVERWEENYRPVLGALAVARGRGLTRQQLYGLTGLAPSKIDYILKVDSSISGKIRR